MVSLIETWRTEGWVYSLAISPDGARVGVGCGSRITIRDMRNGQTMLGPLEGHTGGVHSVAFSPDGRILASGSSDYTIRIWDTETGKAALEPLIGHKGMVCSVTFSPDGHLLISGSLDSTIRLWDPFTGHPVDEPIRTASYVLSVTVSTNSKRVIAGLRDGNIDVYDIATKTILSRCTGHTDCVKSVTLSPDGRRIASTSDDHTVRIWDAETSQAIVTPLKGHTNFAMAVTFSPDGRYIVSGSNENTIKIWDAETGIMRNDILDGHNMTVRTVAFTPDGTRLISGSGDSTIKLWDVRSLGIQTNTLNQHTLTEARSGRTETVTTTTPDGIASLLDAQGCRNMTGQLDMATCGGYPIAYGGFGDVYRCRLKNQIEIAIKTIRLHPDQSERTQEYVNYITRELCTWSKCQHPNVLQMLGVVVFRDQIGMIADWKPNGNLPHYLKQHPDADRCVMSTDIAAGLAYLHGSGVIHGDLRGENVLISADGAPQLANFGHATMQAQTLQFTKLPTKGTISSRWAAPELFNGIAHSVQTDIYALGMTILETITGDVPYAGKGEHEVLFAVAVEKTCPERSSTYFPEGHNHGGTLWFLLEWCWEFEPEARPTAAEVKAIINRITQVGLKGR